MRAYAVDLINHKDNDSPDCHQIGPMPVAVELDGQEYIQKAMNQKVNPDKSLRPPEVVQEEKQQNAACRLPEAVEAFDENGDLEQLMPVFLE